jgi:hypothetical protein
VVQLRARGSPASAQLVPTAPSMPLHACCMGMHGGLRSMQHGHARGPGEVFLNAKHHLAQLVCSATHLQEPCFGVKIKRSERMQDRGPPPTDHSRRSLNAHSALLAATVLLFRRCAACTSTIRGAEPQPAVNRAWPGCHGRESECTDWGVKQANAYSHPNGASRPLITTNRGKHESPNTLRADHPHQQTQWSYVTSC